MLQRPHVQLLELLTDHVQHVSVFLEPRHAVLVHIVTTGGIKHPVEQLREALAGILCEVHISYRWLTFATTSNTDFGTVTA